MINPVKIGDDLKESYLRYIKAGIPLVDEYYEKEREKLYREDGIIMQPPYIEIVKKYEGKKTLSEICEENGINMEIAGFLNRGLLCTENGEERRLYEHQEQAIVDVLKNKKNMVIITGTGSGKTESFLIPLLANIIEESFSWKQNDKEPALRSIIFYPLNALAEDQMVRLRKSLVREEVKKWYEENHIKERITFGRYISRTPKDKSDLKYRELKYRWDSIKQNIDNTKDDGQRKNLQTLIYTGPCCDKDSAEIIDRKSMQNNPPDILITNYSMLNIMLMRKAEQSMFDKTREWLANDKRNTFTLVIDELHTYRGTAGTEVAYIIKVLLHRLGLSPSSPQVRFLASSASMSVSGESQKYISDFFSTDNSRFSSLFTLIADKAEEKITRNSLPPLPLEKFREISDACVNASCEEAVNNLFPGAKSATNFVETNKLLEWLRYALQDTKTGNLAAKSTGRIAGILFDGIDAKEQKLFLEIFMVLLNMAKDRDALAYQPIRAHYFLRNVEKIYMCVNSGCDAVEPEFRNKNRQYGKMYSQPLSRCSCGSLIYEAIVCRHCGELFFCGYIDHAGKLVNVPDVYNPQKPKVLYKPDMSFYQDGTISDWIRVNFDIRTGNIQPDRHGQYYQYKDNTHERSELPAACPRCDFTTKGLRTGDFSALFRHGTGVQKVNQVCADTLMQILTESDESRKLVIFSDSRQSAAKLAAGIELDHYRDALRQTTLLSFNTNIELLDCLKKWRNREIEEIPEEYREAIKKDKYLRDIRRDILEEMDGGITGAEKEQLDKKLSSLNPSLDYIIAIIMEKLIKAGLNPAGPYPSVFYVDQRSKDKKWYECIKSDGAGFETDTDQKYQYFNRIYNTCKTEILKIMIGSPKRSFESLGLGYYHVRSAIDGIEPEFLDSVLRIIGESNRIFSTETEEQKSFPNRLWSYLKAVKNETKQSRHPTLDKVKNDFIQNNILKGDTDRRLTGENIVFIPAKAGDYLWECRKCKTKHLHNSSGICVYCFAALPETPRKLTVEELSGTYYTHERKIDKLHCEELSGQTNTQDSLDRQRLFQDILYDKENPNVDNIELLSVTTTMEAGVDIGSLLAIMMGNVPPQRFNYQQRVGRAGRRGSPLSIALTFSKGGSHDQIHYANPDRMVAGDPAPPYLDFSSRDVFKRIVYKEILRRAFDDCGISTDQNDSVHGQFGKVFDWKNNKPKIESWLTHKNNFIADYGYLIGEFESDEIKIEKENILKNIGNELIGNIDRTISDKNFNQMYLSERLAAGGRLPMFGFPTQLRYLYESQPARLPAENVTDRHMDLALAIFAPGSEIVKDKKVYLSAGFIDYESKTGRVEAVDGLMKYDGEVLYQCPECWYTAIHDKKDTDNCPICGHIFDKKKNEICDDICSPKGYCVDFNETPKDFDGNYNWHPVKINSRIDSSITEKIELRHIADTNLKMGNNVVPERGVVRTINTNNGELFTIRKIPNKAWVVPDLVNMHTSPATERRIALVATKITGVIFLSINSENPAVCLNPLYKGGVQDINRVRSRLLKSAFLSWGELMRRSVTGFLDIRNNELSVDYSVRRDTAAGLPPYPSIYMMEQLENGAGYTDYLASLPADRKRDVFINSLAAGGEIYDFLSGKHQELCDTSCYDCLCDYYNQQKHGLLNWRLGLDVVLLSNNDKLIPSYTGNDNYWHSILMKFEGIINKQHEPELQLIKEKDYWYTRSKNNINFIYHPLWSDDYILDKAGEISDPSANIRYVSLLEFINNPV
jgi:Lhr-like helicase